MTCSASDVCSRKGFSMAAMKPRTGDGPLEVTKEGRGIVMRVPLEGGGRLVVEVPADEASDLGEAVASVSPWPGDGHDGTARGRRRGRPLRATVPPRTAGRRRLCRSGHRR